MESTTTGFVELKMNLNLKLFYRPDSLINLPKDISEIDKFCFQLMSMNDHLLHYRQELARIHQIPDSMFTYLGAIEKLEGEFLKLKENTNLESNERFVMDFSSAKRTGDISENNNNNVTQAQNNNVTQVAVGTHVEKRATLVPVVHVHKCQELARIHQIPDSMFTYLDAIEKLEGEFLKLKENTNLESNERFVMDFSFAKRTGDISENNNNNGTQAQNNNVTQVAVGTHAEKRATLEPVVHVHKRPGKEVAEETDIEKHATLEPVVPVHKRSGKEIGEGSGSNKASGSGHGRALNAQPLRTVLNSRANPTGIWKKTKRINWTPRLHRKFCRAVEFLGGAKVAKATPIVKLMRVNGLTNNHVRSHLQKYRKQLEKLAAGKSKGEGEGKEKEKKFNGYKYKPLILHPNPQLNNNNSIIIIDDDDDASTKASSQGRLEHLG